MNHSRDESSSSNVSVASSNGGKFKRNKTNLKHPNPNTVETVRLIMEQEGRSARNLVSWSIPLDTYGPQKGKSNKSKQTNSQRKRTQSCEAMLQENDLLNNNSNDDRSSSGERPKKSLVNQSRNLSRHSNSGNRKPVNIRARYWAYLFENLRRAVDEIYITCEGDSSVVECKEVLLMLDNYHHEFQALIDWINLQKRLENADAHDRPTSLAWEVRKSSPGRPRQKMTPRGMAPALTNMQNRKINSATVTTSNQRNIQSQSKDFQTQPKTTWADRVKGVKHISSKPATTNLQTASKTNVVAQKSVSNNKTIDEVPDSQKVDDGGEWETVAPRSRQTRHAKSHKSSSETKLSVPHIKVETVVSHSETTIESYSHKQQPDLACQSGSSYVNVVVDRIIGSGGMTSPVSENRNADISKAAVEFSQNCFEKTNVKEKIGLAKIEFQGDANDEALCDLDAAEADFFKAALDDNTDEEDQPTIPLYNGESKKRKEVIARDHLDQLEEEAASLARTLHAEHDASIAVAEEQERDLRRQIQEVEDAKEQETPEIDTDCDSARSSAGARDLPTTDKPLHPLEWTDFVTRFEVHQPAGVSWNELVEEEELREPGRAVQMHEKLSSPSRKITPAESKRKQEEKHRRAEARRLQMHNEKTQKVHELTEKVQEVVSWKNDLIQRQRDLLQSGHTEKLARAEEQRAMQLLSIKRKAQAEDTKVNEIAFINELQEQNKRHEVLMRIGEHESRIQELEQERTKMQEIKSFKEESVKERRRAIEKERQDRIEELKMRRKEQDARIEQQKMEKEKEREKIARDRARERELRLSALNAAQQEAVTELQKKIQLKHDESERRHQEQLEQRKEKAVELSLGRFSSLTSSGNFTSSTIVTSSVTTSMTSASTQNAATPKLSNGPVNGTCDCNTQPDVEDAANNPEKFTSDENSNIVAKNDAKEDGANSQSSGSMTSPRSNTGQTDEISQEDLLKIQERKKTMKKRMKKLKTRMSTRGKEFMKRLENKKTANHPTNKSKIVRLIKDVNRQLTNQKECSGPWPTNRVSALDRALGEMNRILEKQNPTDRASFLAGGGFAILEEIFNVLLKEDDDDDDECPPFIPDKSLSIAATTFRMACTGCHDNCVYALCSNKLVAVVDILMLQISKHEVDVVTSFRNNPTSSNKNDVASPSLLRALAVVLYDLGHNPPTETEASSKTKSMVHLMTSSSKDERNVLEAYLNRGLDVISYVVASGVLDVLSRYLSSIRHEVVPGSNMAAFVEHGLAFLESTTSFISMRNRFHPEQACTDKKQRGSDQDTSNSSWDNDPTQLLPALQHTELMGIVSVLYGLLLHGAPERPTTLRSASSDDNTGTANPSELKSIPEHTLCVALAVMSVLNAVAEMNLPLLQASLGAEGVSLEFRHICTYLLWYCVQGDYTDLLHEVIICVGHFTLDNHRNQDLVDSGAQPTVLQQLCVLPFSYFSCSSLMHILFPTLIACCHDNDANLEMLEQEASGSLLAGYIQMLLQDDDAKGDNAKKSRSNGDGKLPRSLADASLFDQEFLRKALQYFNEDHAISDVNTNAQPQSMTS